MCHRFITFEIPRHSINPIQSDKDFEQGARESVDEFIRALYKGDDLNSSKGVKG